MKTFTSVAQMKLSFLTAGQQVETTGYYVAGDGGGAKYLIKASEAVDGFGSHELAGSTVAILQHTSDALIKQFGAVGDGVADDVLNLQAAFNASDDVPIPKGTYLISSDLDLVSNQILHGLGAIFTGAGNINVIGTAAGNTSDLTANALRDAKTVDVVTGNQFAAGNAVEILSSPDEADNISKLQFAELNEVESVTDNVVTLKYPLAHPYTTGFGTEPKLTIVDNLITDVVVDGFEFQGGDFLPEYVDGLQLLNCKFSNKSVYGAGGTTWGSCRNVKLDVSFEDAAGAGSGSNAHMYLYNVIDFELKAKTYGGFKDGIRMWGCADGDVWVTIHEAANRDCWLYQCDNINLWHPTLIGSQINTTNIEILLFDYARNCHAIDPYIDEINKVGASGPNMFEFRQACENSTLRGGAINVYGNFPVIVKATANNVAVLGITFLIRTTGTKLLIDIAGGEPSPRLTGLRVDGCVIRDMVGTTDTISLVRSSSGVTFTTNIYDFISVTNNIFERVAGTILTLAGDGTGTKVGIVRVTGNSMLNGDGTSGSLVTISGLPVEYLRVTDNIMQDPGTRNIISNSADHVVLANNNPNGYSISNQVTLVIDGLGAESANAEEPVAANWLAGQIVDFTDTGDASGNGIYMLMLDGSTWQQLA